MRTKGIELLMPLQIYKDVAVCDGEIEIAGHIYHSDELGKYNQQNIVVREYKDELILLDKDCKYIGCITK